MKDMKPRFKVLPLRLEWLKLTCKTYPLSKSAKPAKLFFLRKIDLELELTQFKHKNRIHSRHKHRKVKEIAWLDSAFN